MAINLQDQVLQSIITHPNETDTGWQGDLQRFESNDLTFDRKTASENSVKALQRLLVFLGYSTSSGGSFGIDGDFGPGTNRAVAQFQFEHGLNPAITREMLCYECTFKTARKNITAIPNTRLDLPTLEQMIAVANENIAASKVLCGSLDDALFQLNALHRGPYLSVREILKKYGDMAIKSAKKMSDNGRSIRPEWILAIIRQESEGVVRPRFEQHIFTRTNNQNPSEDLSELRFQSMSFGLGQVMGFNYKTIGAPSAKDMFCSPIEDQVLYVGKFLAAGGSSVRSAIANSNPSDTDFRNVARYYNGGGFAAHHYDESIAKWFAEFKRLM